MSVANNILNFFKLDPEDEELEEMEQYEEERQASSPRYSTRNTAQPRGMREEEAARPRTSILSGTKPKMVSMPNQMYELNFFRPTKHSDTQDICDSLLDHIPVIVNLEDYPADRVQSIMDFICGCVYAIDGSYQVISDDVYIFAPKNVHVHGDMLMTHEGSNPIQINHSDF